MTDISALIGLTLVSATGEYGDTQMIFVTDTDRKFRFYHYQNCCESVAINDVIGDLSDLVGSPIFVAEERTSDGSGEDFESATWTFYEFATNKGSVTVRWLGVSNGYYSEGVTFEEIEA
jgi:hypothetical protein